MKLLTGPEIQKAIKECAPKRIAVAFVGADWVDYIPADGLKQIIIWPSPGTSPRGFKQLVDKLGWDNVFLLDHLHAKIYLGESSAVIGSANLSRNGLGPGGNIEACISTSDIGPLNDLFAQLLVFAKQNYPTKAAKVERFERHQQLSMELSASRLEESRNGAPNILDFDPSSGSQFYVSWHLGGRGDRKEKLEAIDDDVRDAMPVARRDTFELNRWMLMWRITNDDRPHKTANLEWLYIHERMKDGFKDKDYPDAALELKLEERPPEPFILDENVRNAFMEVAANWDEFRRIFVNDDTDGGAGFLERTRSESVALVKQMKKAISR